MAKKNVSDKVITMRPSDLVVAESVLRVGDVVEVVMRLNGVEVVSEYASYTVTSAPGDGRYLRAQVALDVKEMQLMSTAV